MKKIYLFCLFLISFQAITAQIYTQKVDEKSQLLDKTEITTNILYDRVFPMAKLLMFNENTPDTSQAVHFYQAYSEIQRADYNNRWQTAQDFALDVEAQNNAIPLGILNVDFEYLDNMAIADNLLDIQGPDSLLVDVPNRSRSPYIKENALVISPLLFDTESLTVNFVTGSTFTLQAANVNINNLQADFGNGQGYQNMPLSGSKTVTFSNTGIYTLKFKINLSNNTIKYTYAKIRVNNGPRVQGIEQPSKSPGTIDFCTIIKDTLTANIGFQGYTESRKYYGTGSFAVYKGGNSFDKPIIVLDGFDPMEGEEKGVDVDDIYDDFLNNPSNNYLGSDLQSQGYDIIPLNFEKREADDGTIINGGTDYIERNAMVLVQLISGINNSSCWNLNKPIKIIGFSMGGLVVRYALRYMEMNNIPHNTNLFISVDSPHKGAVVPMGLQQTGDFFEDLLGIDIADKVLKSPAAKQMLKHHYLSGSESPAGAPGFHDRFYNTLNTMGFPQQTRNIAVVNGVTTGLPTNTAGERYLEGDGEILIFDGDIDLHFSPDRGMISEVAKFRAFIGFIFWDIVLWSRTHRVYTSNSTGSLENAPGGYFGAEDMVAKFLGSNSGYGENYFVANWFSEINTPRFSFIPVKSALAYSGGNPDLYEDFSTRNLVCTGETPFDSYFTARGGNQEHISLNNNSAEYIKNEINGTQRSPNVLTGDAELNGPEVVCEANVVYNIPNCGASVDSWSVSSNLQIINETNSYVTVKAENSYSSGTAYVEANYLGTAPIRKNIFIGKPRLKVDLGPDFYQSRARAEITGRYTSINDQEIIDTNLEVVSGSGLATITLTRYGNKFVVIGQGSSNTHWYKRIKFTATNPCGSYFIMFTLEPPPLEPCNDLYAFEATGVNVFQLIPPDPCGININTTTTNISSLTVEPNAQTTLENKIFTICVYNFSGTLLLKTDEKTVDLNAYKDGIYILKAEIDGKTYTKKVLKN